LGRTKKRVEKLRNIFVHYLWQWESKSFPNNPHFVLNKSFNKNSHKNSIYLNFNKIHNHQPSAPSKFPNPVKIAPATACPGRPPKGPAGFGPGATGPGPVGFGFGFGPAPGDGPETPFPLQLYIRLIFSISPDENPLL
jgi:hypothetical protein